MLSEQHTSGNVPSLSLFDRYRLKYIPKATIAGDERWRARAPRLSESQ